MRLALATIALIGVATTSGALTPEVLPQLIVVGGEPAAVPDTDITLLLTEVDDQRCPTEVDCVWAGMIRVHLTVTTPAAQQEITLCNQCGDASGLATAAGQTFGLIGLAPSTEELAKLGRPPELTDYAVTVTYAPAG